MGDVSDSSRNQKRYRRTAQEISRKYMCWCGKSYGSEGSLNQHKKLKKHFRDPYEEGQINNQMEQEAAANANASATSEKYVD